RSMGPREVKVPDKQREPWNPFYVLLIVASIGFVMMALAYALVPVLEDKAREAGSAPPASPLRDSLRSDGWIWLLATGAAVAVLGLLSMGYDRLLRALKKPPAAETIGASSNPEPQAARDAD